MYTLSVEAVEANDMLSPQTTNTSDNEHYQRTLNDSQQHEVTIKERRRAGINEGQGFTNKMVIWNQKAGRVETGIVAALTMLNSVVNTVKQQKYWHRNLDRFIMQADTGNGRHKIEHLCHIIMGMTYLMNTLIFVSCLPVFYTILSGNFAVCRQRRHGLLPFILIHIFTLISSFNRMVLTTLLTEARSSNTGDIFSYISVYILDISIDTIALFLMISFYRNLRSYKVDPKDTMASSIMNDDIEKSPSTKPSKSRKIVTTSTTTNAGKTSTKGYYQFKDTSYFVGSGGEDNKFEYVKC